MVLHRAMCKLWILVHGPVGPLHKGNVYTAQVWQNWEHVEEMSEEELTWDKNNKWDINEHQLLHKYSYKITSIRRFPFILCEN